MGTVTILPGTDICPITKIGRMAGVCWDADTSDDEKNYKRGWDCIESGHGRVLEYVNVEMIIDGYSARVMREWYTHIGGMPTRLQASTRYIDYGNFDYVVPPSLEKAGVLAKTEYNSCMLRIRDSLKRLERMGVPREDIALLLPLGMTTRIVCKHNARNLIDMSRQRECEKAYWEYRDIFRDLKLALTNYSEEWARLVAKTMHPKCVELGHCTEKRGCGMYGNGEEAR